MESPQSRLYTLHEVAEVTSMSYKWLWRQCRNGKLDHYAFGSGAKRSLRMDQRQLNELIGQAYRPRDPFILTPSKASR